MTRPLSKQLYDNILAITPEGDPLCRCNQKKANWYIQRDLAEVVSENPTIIRLKFKPKGVGHIGDDFYLAERVNVCVVCGTDEEQTRHHIVPYCFRRYFPEKVKQHNSHDIVPLCTADHERYEVHADKLKKAISQIYKVSFPDKGYGKSIVDKLTNLQKFIILWRHHFVRTMSPAYMPKNWSLYRKMTCDD